MRLFQTVILCFGLWIIPYQVQAQRVSEHFDSAAAVVPGARAAANLAPIDNHFLLSTAAAVPAGYLALIAAGDERWPKVILATSVVGVAALFVHANENFSEPPDSLLSVIPENLRDDYARAYRARIQSRQSNQVLGGAALGIMTGLLILFTSFPST